MTAGSSVVRVLDRSLPVWFLAWSAVRLYQLGFGQLGLELSWLGRDFRIYRNAAIALLDGTDPWAAFDTWNGRDWHFAAPPVAAQLFTPFAVLPEGLGFALYLGLSVGVLALAIRRLGLPWWWILFPPVMEGIAAANPQILVTGLLVLGVAGHAGSLGTRTEGGVRVHGRIGQAGRAATAAVRAIAAGLKLYAVVPIAARREWGALAAFIALAAVSFVVSAGAWIDYVTRFGVISSRLADESEGGVSAALFLDPAVFGGLVGGEATARLAGVALFGLLVVIVLLAAVRDTRAAGWVAVPLLWPAAEYHYATFAMPIARRLSTWIIAVPTIPTYLLGLLILAYEIAAARPPIAEEPAPVGLGEWLAVRPAGRRADA